MSTASPAGDGDSRLNGRRRAALNGIVPVLLGLGVGLVIGVVWPDGDSPEPEPAPQAESTPPPWVRGPLPSPSREPSPSFRPLPASPPSRLVIPAIDVDAPIVPIETSADRVLQIPPDPDVVGWWTPSAQPGATTGQTLLSGHAVRDGSGPLNRVPELKRGNLIDVVTDEGRMRYRVTHLRTWDRETVARNADELFGQETAKGRLVLVTCTDWNGEVWLNNVIAFGLPLGEPVGS